MKSIHQINLFTITITAIRLKLLSGFEFMPNAVQDKKHQHLLDVGTGVSTCDCVDPKCQAFRSRNQ